MALKAVAPGLLHKSDVGGVRLHLAGPSVVTEAAADIAAAVREATGSQPTGFLVQRMVPAGVEMLVGVVNDPQFGPTVACGAGGTLVELLRDVSVRLSPLTRGDATSMLRELRSFPLLEGYRGAPRCDVDALEDVLLRIGALAEDHPQIAELDCNPVMVSASEQLLWTRACGLRPRRRGVRSVLAAESTHPKGLGRRPTPRGVVGTSQREQTEDTPDARGNRHGHHSDRSPRRRLR